MENNISDSENDYFGLLRKVEDVYLAIAMQYPSLRPFLQQVRQAPAGEVQSSIAPYLERLIALEQGLAKRDTQFWLRDNATALDNYLHLVINGLLATQSSYDQELHDAVCQSIAFFEKV
jgi:hypothetical protein